MARSSPKSPKTAVAVADHYDELDPIYRRVWGEHDHHGLWATGLETPSAAVEALVDTVGDRLRLMPGEACVHIGCGYGSAARRLAVTHRVTVAGFHAFRRAGPLCLAETDASGWKVRHLLEPICREGRLPSMGTHEEYEAMAMAAGFAITGYETSAAASHAHGRSAPADL